MSLPLPLARSLTTRMTLVTLVIFIAGLWCLAFYANLILRETMQRQLSEQQATEVEFQATTLNEDLRERAAALEFMRTGDTLVVWKLDRLARSTQQLLETVAHLAERGIGLKILTQNIDTTSAGGRLIFTVLG